MDLKLPHRTALMASLAPGAIGAEIGVQRGRFSRIILRKAQPRVLYLVDLWERHPDYPMPKAWTDAFQLKALHETLTAVRPHIAEGVVRPLCGSSLQAAKLVWPGELDWVYIDACHRYDPCMEDLQAWSTRVKHDGMIMVHDYERKYRWARQGTVKATDDFAKAHGVREMGVTRDEKATAYFRKNWRD